MYAPPAVRTHGPRTTNRGNRYASAANRTDEHGSDRRHLEVADETADGGRHGPREPLLPDVRMDLDLRGDLRPGPHVLPADLDVDHAVVLHVLRRAEDRLGRPDRDGVLPADAVRHRVHGPPVTRRLPDGPRRYQDGPDDVAV